MNTLLYVTIAAYLAVMVVVGFVFKRFNRNVSDYFRGGSRGTWWLVGMSAFMSSFSVWTFTGAAGVAFEAGWSVIFISLANALGFFLNFICFAPWFRQLRATTGPEVIGMRFNAPTQQAYAYFYVIMGLLHSALHLFGFAIFCSSVFGIPVKPLTIALGLIVLIYSVTGGAWATMANDFLQGVILFPITVVVCWAALEAVGGFHGLAEKISSGGLTHSYRLVKNPGEMAASAFTWGWICALMVKNSITWNTLSSAARYFTVKDGREARKAALLAMILMLAGPVLWYVPPMVGRVLYADEILASPLGKPVESAYAVTCMHVLPAGLLGLVIVAMFAATISSLDLNRPAAIVVKDIYPAICRLIGRKLGTDRQLLVLGHWITALVGILVIALALYFSAQRGKGIFEIMLNIGGYFATPLAFPLFLALLVKKSPPWAALLAVTGGFLCSLSLGTSKSFGMDWNFQQIFFINATVTTAIFLLTGFAWPAVSEAYRKKVDEFFTRMYTPVDFEKEVGGANDLTQLVIIGGFLALMGSLVMVLAAFEGGIRAMLLTGGVGLSLFATGALMYWAGKRSGRPREPRVLPVNQAESEGG